MSRYVCEYTSVPKPPHFSPMHACRLKLKARKDVKCQAPEQKHRKVALSALSPPSHLEAHFSHLPGHDVHSLWWCSSRSRCGKRGSCQPASSDPYFAATAAGSRALDWQVGGSWIFFPHLDQSTAEVSKWQPHPCGASLPAHPCFRKDSLAAQANPLLSCCSRSRPLLALKEGIGLGTEMFRL